MVKREREGEGVLYLLYIKKNPSTKLCLEGSRQNICILQLSKVFKLNGIHLSKGLKSTCIILPVNKMEYTAVKGLILDIIAMCFSDVSQE